jgi:hypothetical protein
LHSTHKCRQRRLFGLSENDLARPVRLELSAQQRGDIGESGDRLDHFVTLNAEPTRTEDDASAAIDG